MLQKVHDAGSQHVHAEKTKVMAGTQTGHDEFLLGDRGRGFFQDAIHLIQTGAARQPPRAHCAVVRQLAFMGGLHRRDRAGFGGRNFQQLPGAGIFISADVKMVADQEQERLVAGKLTRTGHGVAVTQRRGLLDEMDAIGVRAGGGGKSALVAGADHQADFLDAGLDYFFQQDGEGGFGLAIAVHQRLQRQIPLMAARGGNDSFANFHGRTPEGADDIFFMIGRSRA